MTTEMQSKPAGLADAASTMIAGSAENLGQLLGVPVEFTLLDIDDPDTQVPEVIENGIHLSVHFDGALTGDSWFVLSPTDAEAIVKIMTQGMGIDEDDLLGEMGLSALSEAMNQLMAGAATALSNGLGERIDISPPSISMNPEPGEQSGDTINVTFKGVIADHASSRVFWKIDRDLATDLGSRWIAANQAEEEKPETTETPRATANTPAPTDQRTPAHGGVINSVELDIAVELGDVSMTIGELLRMGEGSVVTLNQLVGDNVIMLANGTPVASGEVVVVDGTLGFRVADLITEARGA